MSRSSQVRVELAKFAVLILMGLALLWTTQNGRADLANAQRRGCERGKLDRRENARAWREAQAARRRDRDFHTAAIYASVASQLEARSRINCGEAYPAPGLLPLP